jgi:hypothetical protein
MGFFFALNFPTILPQKSPFRSIETIFFHTQKALKKKDHFRRTKGYSVFCPKKHPAERSSPLEKKRSKKEKNDRPLVANQLRPLSRRR